MYAVQLSGIFDVCDTMDCAYCPYWNRTHFDPCLVNDALNGDEDARQEVVRIYNETCCKD